MTIRIWIVFLLSSFAIYSWAHDCYKNDIEIEVIRTYGKMSGDETYTIYKGLTTDNVVARVNGFGKMNRVIVDTYCVQDNLYTLELTDAGNNGWATGSRIEIIVMGQFSILKTTLFNHDTESFVFYPKPHISLNSEWRYTEEFQENTLWTLSSYDESEWKPLSSATNRTQNRITTYIRRNVQFSIPLVNFASFELGLYTRGAIVIFINGVEVFRVGIKDEVSVAPLTWAQKYDENFAWYNITFPTSLLTFPESSIAIEIHSLPTFNEKPVFFNSFMLLYYGPCSVRYQGSFTEIERKKKPSDSLFKSKLENPALLSDFNGHEEYIYKGSQVDLVFAFDGYRYEYINAYRIMSSHSFTKSDPSTWLLFGIYIYYLLFIYDNNTYKWGMYNFEPTQLDYRDKYSFRGRNQFSNIYLYSNTKHYKYYTMRVLNNNGDRLMKLSEIQFMTCNYITTLPTLQYEHSNYQFIKDASFVYIAPKSTGYEEFTIEPTLSIPGGLIFTSINGTLAGYAHATIPATLFTVQATNAATKEVETFKFYLTISACTYPYVHLSFNTYNGPESSRDRWVFKDTRGNRLHQYVGVDSTTANSVDIVDLCVLEDIYYLNLHSDKKKGGWSYNSYILIYSYINENRKELLYKGRLSEGNKYKVHLNIRYIVPTLDYTLPSIRSSPDGVTSTSTKEWYYATFEEIKDFPIGYNDMDLTLDTQWKPLSTPPTIDSPYIEASSTFFVIRSSFFISNLNKYNGIAINTYAKGGIAVYINHQEMFCRHMSFEDINHNKVSYRTRAKDQSITTQVYTGGILDLHEGWNQITIVNVLVNSHEAIEKRKVLGKKQLAPQDDIYKYYFDISIRLTMDDSMNHMYDIMATAKVASGRVINPPSMMVDDSITSQYISPDLFLYSKDKSIIFSFNNNRIHYINKYCIYSSVNRPSSDILSYSLFSQIDASSTWTLIDKRDGIHFETRSERRCLYLSSVHKSINSIRMDVTSLVSNDQFLTFSEIELYGIFIPQNTTLALVKSSIIVYQNNKFPLISYKDDHFSGFSISPALPTGLFFDSSNGHIYGRTDLITTKNYTISANDLTNKRQSTVLTMAVERCVYPNNKIHIELFSKKAIEAVNPRLELLTYHGKKTLDLVQVGFRVLNEDLYYCLPTGLYMLSFSDQNNAGWNTFTYKITTNDIKVEQGTIEKGESPKIIDLNLGYLLRSNSAWGFWKSSTAPSEEWTTDTENIDGWESYSKSTCAYSTPQVMYYRNTFTIESMDFYSICEFAIDVPQHSGLIVFVNGKELIRYHLKEDGNHERHVHMHDDDSGEEITHYYTAGLDISAIHEGLNIIAVELYWDDHVKSLTDVKRCFDIYIQGYPGHSERLQDAEPWGRYLYEQHLKELDPDTAQEIITKKIVYRAIDDKVISYLDDHITDNLVTTSQCVGSEIGWLYHNQRREYINHYSIQGNSKCINHNPSSWRLYATNQEINRKKDPVINSIDMNDESYNHNNTKQWILLDKQTDIIWKEGELTKYYDISNENSFNAYKIVIDACYKSTVTNKNCRASSLSISSFELFVERLENPCDAVGDYDSVKSGTYSTLPCINGYSGVKRRFCRQGIFEEEEDLCVPYPPSKFEYEDTRFRFRVHTVITPIVPLYTAVDPRFSIEPKLPDGLELNTATGVIQGTPLSAFPFTKYILTIKNPSGQIDTKLDIETFIPVCKQEDEWESINVNSFAYHTCADVEIYEGHLARNCLDTDPPTWGPIVDKCVYKVPYDLSYPKTDFIFYRHVALHDIKLSYKGYIDDVSVTPSLPHGIHINSKTFALEGKPSGLSAKTEYIFTFMNSQGNATLSITINIHHEPCLADGEWPLTEAGFEATLPCTDIISYTGSRKRLCNIGNPPMFLDVVDECKLLPPRNVSYDSGYFRIMKNVPVYLKAYSIGHVDEWMSVPPMKVLELDDTTGDISGSIQNMDDKQMYTIYAKNDLYKVSTNITIELVTEYCEREGNWPDTIPGEFAYIACEDPDIFTGHRRRRCKDISPPRWAPIVDQCELKPPTNLTYINFPSTIYIGSKYTFYPSYHGRVSSFITTGTLPLGISMDATSGIISGSPVELLDNIDFSVKAMNSRGSVTKALTLKVSSFNCEQDTVWPSSPASTVITLDCFDKEHYKGSMKRICLEPNETFAGGWSDIINHCVMLPPQRIHYEQQIYYFRSNMDIPTITPTIDGSIRYAKSIPELPSGILLENSTAALYGHINLKSGVYTYKILVGNEAGEISTTLSFDISRQLCISDGYWPSIDSGLSAVINCPVSNYYVGYQQRLCLSTNNITGQWGLIENYCTLRTPTNIHFKNDHVELYKGTSINDLKPSYVGLVTSCTLTPQLPTGLYFNEETCSIYGKPLTPTSISVYTMTLSNLEKQTMYIFTLTVLLPSCPYQYPWPETEYGHKVYVFCPAGEGGVMSRYCGYSEEEKTYVWMNEDRSRCINSYGYISPKQDFSLIRFDMAYHHFPKQTFTPEIEELTRYTLGEFLLRYGVETRNIYVEYVELISDTTDLQASVVVSERTDDDEGIVGAVVSTSDSETIKGNTDSIEGSINSDEKIIMNTVMKQSMNQEESEMYENVLVHYTIMVENVYVNGVKEAVEVLLTRKEFGNVLRKKEALFSSVTLIGNLDSVHTMKRPMTFSKKVFLFSICSSLFVLILGFILILTGQIEVIEQFINDFTSKHVNTYDIPENINNKNTL
ncbi:hypothetical protein WA158_001244 [Blastocystis sp. Blastoise]